MKNIFSLALFLVLASLSSAQEINYTDLGSAVKEIKSVNINTVDLTDLDPIKKAIGDSRVVVLGEQDHGDAISLAAKSRMVKFLHDKMGFTVLAFEADAYTLLSLAQDKDQSFYLDSLKASIPPYWSKTKDMEGLWQYIAAEKDLQVTGFDIGLNTNYAKEHFEKDLYQNIRQLPFIKSANYPGFQNTLNGLINAKPAAEFTIEEKENFFKSINELILQSKQLPKNQFLQRQLYAVLAKAENYWLRNYREKHMAANLEWLIKHKHPKEKIIVWTASFHAVKDIYAVVENAGERAKHYLNAINKDSVETMIQILRRDNSFPMYVLNMISVSGMYTPSAWTSISNVADSIRIPLGNIEKQVADFKGDYYFLNLKSLPNEHWLHQPFPMIAMLHRNTYRARWPKVFDGLFFIRNMKPLTPQSK